MPSSITVTGTLVLTENTNNNKEGIMNAVCQSALLGIILSSLASVELFLKPKTTL